MKILNFFKGMLPQFSRTRIQDDLRSSRDQYTTFVLPTLTLAAKEFKGNFKSKEAQDLQARYNSFVGAKGNMFADLLERFKKLEPIYDAMDSEVANEFGERVVPSSLSARSANLLRLVSVLSFENRYAMSLVNAVANFECQASGMSMATVSDVTPGELERINSGMVDFAQLLRGLTAVKDVHQTLASIPDIQLDNGDVLKAFSDKVDPMGIFSTGLGFKGSPMYWAQMAYAEYQHDSYRKTEAQKHAFEKRLLALRRMSAGNPSAQAEEDLETITSTIGRLDQKLRDYERSIK